MLRKLTLLLTTLFLLSLLLPGISAHDDDKPTIALLRPGVAPPFFAIEAAVLDTLAATGYLTEAEHQALREGSPVSRQDFAGERVNLIWGDAAFDIAAMNLIVDAALDREPDILFTIMSTPTLAALNATSDMDDPPAVIFTMVYAPYQAGIAEAPCVKPDYVGGVESLTAYDEILPLMMLQIPDLRNIGLIYSSSQASGVHIAAELNRNAAELGLSVTEAAISNLADIGLATEGLLTKGIDALVLSMDLLTGLGAPIVMGIMEDYDIPVFYSHFGGVMEGITIGAGAAKNYLDAALAAHLMVGHLRGEVDLSSTAVISTSSFAVGVNLDTAAKQGIEITDALMEEADMYVRDQAFVPVDMDVLAGFILPSASNPAPDWESLHCSDEMIAEQQAALDAASE